MDKLRLTSLSESIVNIIETICLYVSLVATFAMMFFVTIDVIARRLFQRPITGVVEISEDYLMVALVFLSLSTVYTHGGHVRVTLFLKYIPNYIQRPLNLLLNLASLLFFLLVAAKGWQVTLRALRFKESSNSLLSYPLAPAYFLVVIGSVLLCLRILQFFFDSPTDKEITEEPQN